MNNITMSKAVLACLAYFNIFQHPLRKEEIVNFLNTPIVDQQLDQALIDLLESKSIFKIDAYYLLQDNPDLVANRIAYERRADEKIEEALKIGKLIQKFPFTRAVCISGSLSKHVMKEDSDIDFFIMSKANRIWISKLMLKIYKFIFLKNSRALFCINYFISENNLYIEEQNAYTATELATLIPLGCEKEYEALMHANSWYKKFLPNFNKNSKKSFDINTENKPITSKIIEGLFGGGWGNFVDTSIMKFNTIRNKKKYVDLKKNKDFELMLRATKDQIKVHDSNHQNVTLAKYNKLIKKLDNSF